MTEGTMMDKEKVARITARGEEPEAADWQMADQILALSPTAGVSDTGWRPIETAPRDGTTVLLWAPHWDTALTGWTYGDDAWQDCRKDSYAKPPTHWQPLPTPPDGSGECQAPSEVREALRSWLCEVADKQVMGWNHLTPDAATLRTWAAALSKPADTGGGEKGWQPIETAPDGVWVEVAPGYEITQPTMVSQKSRHNGKWCTDNVGRRFSWSGAKFWRPLSPPAALSTPDTRPSGIQEGWVLVPREPTFDMVSRGGAAVWDTASEDRHQLMTNAYRAMIDAALSEGEG